MPSETTDTSSLQLSITSRAEDAAIVIQCKGKLIADNAGLLKSKVKSLIPQHKRIVLDLSDLSRMDSAGLGVLVGLYLSARSGQSNLQLVNLSKQLRDLLGITNLLSVFEDCGRYGTRMP
jgi:anti-sigma B factor antagonist